MRIRIRGIRILPDRCSEGICGVFVFGLGSLLGACGVSEATPTDLIAFSSACGQIFRTQKTIILERRKATFINHASKIISKTKVWGSSG